MIVINNVELCRQGRSVSGRLGIGAFSRVLELAQIDTTKCLESDSELTYALHGAVVDHATLMLALTISVTVPFLCQRCLLGLNQSFDLNYKYIVADGQPEGIEDADDVDWVEPSAEMDLVALIEDELLMAMPIAPAHSGECESVKKESGERQSPFAVLKGRFK